MVVTHTFSLFLVLRLLTSSASCSILNIGEIESYANGATVIGVKKFDPSIKFYGHSSGDPFFLKEIYNGNEKLQFDSILTGDQLLLSASVYWVSDVPSVVQLNLEKSSVVLLNEDNSLVSIEAIFSGKTITNTSGRTHLKSDQVVDVDLSKFKDYTHNSKTVPVTELKLTGYKFRRYKLRSYNLESFKVGALKYDNQELKTLVNNVGGKMNSEVSLDLPNKNEVYGINVYSYADFPLMMEVLYTYNTKLFYGFTPELKWHQVYLPSFNDPSHSEFLYKKLNYYACKNGFKYTIDIRKIPTDDNKEYQIQNYCNLLNNVNSITNTLTIEILEQSINPKYHGYEHKSKNGKLFFVDHLMDGNSPLIFEETPTTIKSVQVFYPKDKQEPCAIGLFNTQNKAVAYTLKNGNWKRYYTIVKKHDEKYIMAVERDAIDLLPDTVKIRIDKNSKHQIPTIKRDMTKFKERPLIGLIDLNSLSQYSFLKVEGSKDRYIITINEDHPVYTFIHSGYVVTNFIHWPNLIYCQCLEYFYDYKTHDMYLDLYTNVLYVYRFKKNYYSSYSRWEFVSSTPALIYDPNYRQVRSSSARTRDRMSIQARPLTEIQKYFEATKDLDLRTDVLKQEHINLLPEKITIVISKTSEQVINTIKRNRDLINENKLKIGEYDIWWYNWSGYQDTVEYEGDFYGTLTAKAKENHAIRPIKYYGYDIMDLAKMNLCVQFLDYYYDPNSNYLYIELYTDALYIYKYRIKYTNTTYKWELSVKRQVTAVDRGDRILLYNYFEATKDWESFEYTKK